MNFITVLYLFTCFLTLYLGVYLLRLNHKAAISKVFFLFCITGSLWAFTYAFMHSAPNAEVALFWRKLSVPCWCLHYGFILHFFLLLTKRKKILEKLWIYPLIYLPGIILTGLFLLPGRGVRRENLFLTDLGWTYLLSPDDPLRFWGFTIYYLGYTILTIMLSILWWKRTEFEREKKQAQLILLVSVAAIVIGSLPDIILPSLGIIETPPLGIITNVAVLLTFWYVIKEYRFMPLSTERIHKDILETMEEGLLTCDVEGTIKVVNNSTQEMLSYKKDELINQPINLVFAARKDGELFELSHQLNGDQEYIFKSEEKTLVTKNGRKFPGLFSASILRDDWGDALGTVCTFQDITERKQAEERFIHLTFHDQLTGLYNRTFLEKKLKEINSSRKVPVGLIMIDLNGLKLINDGFGHPAGDKMLKRTARVLREACREDDIVGRWGGDEFIIIMYGASNEEVEKISKCITEISRETPEDPVPISLAVGSAIKEEKIKDIYDVLKKAEDEMYNNKLLQHKSVQSDALDTLLKTLGTKSNETEKHVRRLQELADALGSKLDLSPAEMDKLSLLASLHDIGKVTISEEILNKSGDLNGEEWNKMKKHPEIGYRIAFSTNDFAHIAEEILHHHEWWDGSGYPEGLSGEEIPLLSRIIAIIDAYDVMTSSRAYKEPMTQEEAKQELKRYAGIQFDPELVEVFIGLLDED